MLGLEQQPRLLPESLLSPEQPGHQRVLVIDAGSTNLKMGYWLRDSGSLSLPDAKTNDRSLFQNIHFKERIREVKIGDLPKFKVVSTDRVLGELSTAISEMESNHGPADMYVLTGFVNSLTATVTKEGQRKTLMLPDEPNATTKLTSDQQDVLLNAMPNKRLFKIAGLKPTSSLMKVVFLKNHPEVIKELMGNDVTFGELQFSTMRGLITDILIQRRDPHNRLPLLVPAGGDSMAFAGGNVGMDTDRMKQMLEEMGLDKKQIHFLPIPMVHVPLTGEEFDIFNVQDFHANLWLINQLIDIGRLPPYAAFLELDSKAKVSSRRLIPPLLSLKTLGNMEYFVQEVGTKALSIFGRQLAEQDNHMGWSWDWDYYKFLRETLGQYKSRASLRFGYYPDSGPLGTLVDTEGGALRRVDPTTDLTRAGYSHEEIKEMMLAVTCGMAFDIRRRQADNRNKRNAKSTAENVIYGGLGYDPNAVEVVAQCLEGKVALLELAYAGQAAFLQAMSYMRPLDLTGFHVNMREIETVKRNLDYNFWLKTRNNLPVKGVNDKQENLV